MRKCLKQLTAVLIISALVIIPFNSSAIAQSDVNEDHTTCEYMVADALLVRPVAIVSTIVGTAVFIVSLPFSALGGNTGAAYQKLMVEPAKFAFKRPLGEF